MTSPSRQAAEDLVRLALRRPLSERESFLHDNCPDPILRAEIDALLKLRGEAAASPGRRSGDDLDDEEDLPPGSHVGPYIVVDRLGRGGMGQVFLGSDPRLHRKVALKCLTPSQPGGESTGDDDLRQRILHEARAAARINHPNVATIHDVLEHEGRAFIVMEYVEGESLAARLIRERLPIERVITIGRQLAAALSAAHAKGVIHRDLKPGNVHLTPEGSAKVLDFGVAKAATALATASTTRAAVSTRGARESGQLGSPGTPGYMSPEQMLGGAVDERSDIYSLGVMLFEMSTGRRPFPSTDPVALAAAVAQRPPRADGAGQARAGHGVGDDDGWCAAACSRCRHHSKSPPFGGFSVGDTACTRDPGSSDLGRVQPDARANWSVWLGTASGLHRLGSPLARRPAHRNRSYLDLRLGDQVRRASTEPVSPSRSCHETLAPTTWTRGLEAQPR
jgi:serine/threonine protein kinase